MRWISLAVSLAALSVLTVGCGSGGRGSGATKGTVYGDVTAGPTCPVEQPDSTGCADVPVAGSVEFWQDESVTIFATIHHDGAFTADVPFGRYIVKVNTGSLFPTCPEQSIEVTAASAVVLHIACDTGIR